MNKTLTRIGIAIALLLMVAELTYINSKSLLYLVSQDSFLDKYFAIVGALAFSMVTVLVMRNSLVKWVKYVFPVFDTALVFCGLNIKEIGHIPYGEVAFWLTLFMAVFAGLITYSLGLINYKAHDMADAIIKDTRINLLESELGEFISVNERLKTDNEQLMAEINSLTALLKKNETDLGKIRSDYIIQQGWINEAASQIEKYKTQCETIQTENLNIESKNNELIGLLNESRTEIEIYKPIYIAAERSRILKKSEKNRTADEIELLTNTDKLN